MTISFSSNERKQEAQWITTSACTAKFLLLLGSNPQCVDFTPLKSLSLNEMEFLQSVGITNPGSLLMILHALVVLPRETFWNDFIQQYPDVIAEVNGRFAAKCQQPKTTYPADANGIDYLRHIRNAVSHGAVKGAGSANVEFSDKAPNNPNIYCTLPFRWTDIGELCAELFKISGAYVKMLENEPPAHNNSISGIA